MEFGKLKNIDHIDFRLPPDCPVLFQVLQKAEKLRMSEKKIYVGCPIWSRKEWVGKLYPTGTKAAKYLYYYTRQFNTIELNTTHYQIPDRATIDRWREESADDFKFSPKFPQPISHEKALQGVQDLTQQFCEAILGLEDHLGNSFLQLPPYFEASHLYILENFLKIIPKEVPLSVEFRHQSWFKGNALQNAIEMLQNYNTGLVITDVAGRRDVLHQCLSNDTAMIRFVGNGLHPTDYTRVDEWINRLTTWFEAGLKTLYFFVHEPDNVKEPDLAEYVIQQMNSKWNISLKVPLFYSEIAGKQGKLF